MKTELIKNIEAKNVVKFPKFDIGDTIAVNLIVREGDKKRNQLFRGIVIAIKGTGIRKTFTVRKISLGIGVEKIIPFFSPNIESIKLIRKGSVRKSKLYYMRKRIGKKALKVNEGTMDQEEIEEELPEVIDEVEKTETIETNESK